MKKLYFYQGKATITEVPEPQLLDQWILVKTAYSFISPGTERQTLNNQAQNLVSRFTQNLIANTKKLTQLIKNEGLVSAIYQLKAVANKFLESGYACSGEVVWADPASGFAVGDFVACAGAGFACHAEIIAVPKNLTVKLSSAAMLKEASATAIAAVALQGLRQASCTLGETVVIQGLGLVGLLTLQLAKIAGLKVIGIDTQSARLDLATKFGCDHALLATEANLEKTVAYHTAGHGADAIISCASGTQDLLNQALSFVKKQGKVIVVGDVPLNFERQNFYHKEATILASCSYGPGRYQQNFEQLGMDYPFEFVRWTEQRNLSLCAELIDNQKLNIQALISKTFAFEQATMAFEQLQQNNSLGLVLEFNSPSFTAAKEDPAKPQVVLNNFNFLTDNRKINVAIVGAGGFAKTRLLPELNSLGNNNIQALIDPCANNLINVAEQFNIPHKFADLEQALAKCNIDVVVICSPHALHLQQTLTALKHGKAVFVEKPPATNLTDLETLQSFLKDHPEAFYCVDFNRSHSPYFDKIHTAVINRATPLVIDYRVNAGFIAPQHWVFSAENNGRIVGEACHMLEFLLALTDSQIKTINVNTISGHANLTKDNFVASMNFADGSQASLIYTSLGNNTQDKERIEIFWQGRSVVLNDFSKLQGFGMPMFFNKSSLGPEKGYRQILKLFFNALKKNEPEMLYKITNRAIKATYTALLIKDLVDAGGGFITLAELQKTTDQQANHQPEI